MGCRRAARSVRRRAPPGARRARGRRRHTGRCLHAGSRRMFRGMRDPGPWRSRPGRCPSRMASRAFRRCAAVGFASIAPSIDRSISPAVVPSVAGSTNQIPPKPRAGAASEPLERSLASGRASHRRTATVLALPDQNRRSPHAGGRCRGCRASLRRREGGRRIAPTSPLPGPGAAGGHEPSGQTSPGSPERRGSAVFTSTINRSRCPGVPADDIGGPAIAVCVERDLDARGPAPGPQLRDHVIHECRVATIEKSIRVARPPPSVDRDANVEGCTDRSERSERYVLEAPALDHGDQPLGSRRRGPRDRVGATLGGSAPRERCARHADRPCREHGRCRSTRTYELADRVACGGRRHWDPSRCRATATADRPRPPGRKKPANNTPTSRIDGASVTLGRSRPVRTRIVFTRASYGVRYRSLRARLMRAEFRQGPPRVVRATAMDADFAALAGTPGDRPDSAGPPDAT